MWKDLEFLNCNLQNLDFVKTKLETFAITNTYYLCNYKFFAFVKLASYHNITKR